jgi:hypothetical protein
MSILKEAFDCNFRHSSSQSRKNGRLRMANRNTSITVLVGDDKHAFHPDEQQLSNRGESVFEDLDVALLCKVFLLLDYLQVSSVQERATLARLGWPTQQL